MRTQAALTVTIVELDDDPESKTAGLVYVTADGTDQSEFVESVTFIGAITDKWAVGRRLFVTVQDESDGDWHASGAPIHAPRGFHDRDQAAAIDGEDS